jgi:predicted enzyme related to lactoylglutathione lyase
MLRITTHYISYLALTPTLYAQPNRKAPMFTFTQACSSFSARDMKATHQFYSQILGLKVETDQDTMGMLTIHLSPTDSVLVYPKDNHQAATYTVLNFTVADLEKSVDDLVAKGVVFEHYQGFKQDEKGIARSEEGPDIAWFTDPSGNIIAVMEQS